VTARAWKRRGEALVRELRFRDFDEAMGFVQRVADAAVDYGRRPDMCILESNHVRLTVANPHHAGVTLAEQRLMQRVDAVVAEEYDHAATEA
jgi:4a-hydroxytetrahydrobiopterin dehydratase